MTHSVFGLNELAYASKITNDLGLDLAQYSSMTMMVVGLMQVFLFGLTLIRIIRLPRPCPFHQLLPVSALMFCTKPSDAPNFLILELYRGIRLAHEALPNQIDAMSDMRRRCHHWYIFLGDFVALRGGLMQRPVPFANAILGSFISEDLEAGKG